MIHDCSEAKMLANEAIDADQEPDRTQLFEELNDPFYGEFFNNLSQPLIDCYQAVLATVA